MVSNKKAPHPFLKLIGENIKKYRKDKGLSMEKLAVQIGLNKGHIYRMEKGYNITALTILKISLALDILPSDLLDVDYHYNKEELAGLINTKKSSKGDS